MSGETGDGPFRAFYPASLTSDGTTITLSAAQTYVEGTINEFPMYAESAANQLAFKNLCGVLKLHLTKANTNIASITVKANAEICGDFTVSYVNNVPCLSYTGNGSNTVTLACATAQDISNGKDFYIVLPATFDSLKDITLTTDDGRTCTKTVKSNVCINVQRSEVTGIELSEGDMVFPPIGSKGGLFTVNSNGDQVWFSQGNLQYQASTDTWRFAEHQYDRIGNDNVNISSSYSGWIDLFGWGTGGNPTLVSADNIDYTTFVDWGVNTISNGGNTANCWRSLTRQEWTFIFINRSNASSKYGGGKVNGVGGIIILPDDWTLPSGCNFDAGMDGWDDNVYSSQQWAKMEQAGAVFLPATGVRVPGVPIHMASLFGGRDNSVNNFGDYWTATQGEQYGGYSVAFFGEERVFGIIDYNGKDGRAVRLAKMND